MKFQIIYDDCEQKEIDVKDYVTACKEAVDYCFECFSDFDADLIDIKRKSFVNQEPILNRKGGNTN